MEVRGTSASERPVRRESRKRRGALSAARAASPVVGGRHRPPSQVDPSRSVEAVGEKGVRVTPGFHFGGAFSSENGASRLDGVAPLSGLSRDSKAPRLSGPPNPFARAVRMEASVGQPTARVSSGSISGESTTVGCSGCGRVGLCVAARTANSLHLGRYGRYLRGTSRGFFRKEEVPAPCCSQLGSISVGSSNEGSESVSSCEEGSSVGVLGFRVEMLQNLVSGVWLERRASVVAEASGRGLAQSG